MGMPGKALYVVLGIIGTEIVQKQKRVEKRHLAVAENSLQVNAGSFNSRDALQDFPDFSCRRHLFVPPVDSFWQGQNGKNKICPLENPVGSSPPEVAVEKFRISRSHHKLIANPAVQNCTKMNSGHPYW
jgi:hypothetical protein